MAGSELSPNTEMGLDVDSQVVLVLEGLSTHKAFVLGDFWLVLVTIIFSLISFLRTLSLMIILLGITIDTKFFDCKT